MLHRPCITRAKFGVIGADKHDIVPYFAVHLVYQIGAGEPCYIASLRTGLQ
jgi:hypothetical protein